MGHLIKRKRCKHFDRIENGQNDLQSQEYPYVEQALQLPHDFIDQLVRFYSPYSEASAEEILKHLSVIQNEEQDTSSSAAIQICNACARQVLCLLERYALPLTRHRTGNKTCVCGGKQRSDADMLLRMALMISNIKSLLMLGGSEHIKLACRDISNIKINIVLGDKKAGKHINSSDISSLDVLIVVRGEVAHATTAPYLNVLKSLPAEKRPIVLYSRSSNITGVAEAILSKPDTILGKTGTSSH
jgi:DNA polymerase/3'-5' exonuclease PolX